MEYYVGNIPDASPELLRELRAIAEALAGGRPALTVDMQYKPPKKVRDGLVVLADGVTWNPGSGPGFYGYRAGAWRFLG